MSQWPDEALISFGRAFKGSQTPAAAAVRAEMRRRIEAANPPPLTIPCYHVRDLRRMAMTGEQPEPATAYVIEYGPASPK